MTLQSKLVLNGLTLPYHFYSDRHDEEYEEPKQMTVKPNTLGTPMRPSKNSQVSKKSDTRKVLIPSYKTKAGGAMQYRSPYARGNSPMQIILPSTPMTGNTYSQSRSRSRSKSIGRSTKSPSNPLKDKTNVVNSRKVPEKPKEPVPNRYRTEKYLKNLGTYRPQTER